MPKTLEENLEFREALIRWGSESEENATTLWIACKRSLLFYINAFGWAFDPRDLEKPAEPFITWEYQDQVFRTMLQKFGKEDMAIEKSRDMGASWMTLWLFEWQWHFYNLRSFLLVSAKEDLVDNKENPDALMWKLDFIHKMTPKWLLPRMMRTNLHMYNEETGSTIDGISTTGDSSRGGRRTSALFDEFAAVENDHAILASSRDVTRSRIFVSTPKGTNNAYYQVVEKMRKTNPSALFTMHWSKHPRKSLGLETKRGKLTSPWYENECSRAAHPKEIAQELDIDYLGSNFAFFDATIVNEIRDREHRAPYLAGELQYDTEAVPSDFSTNPRGRVQLWMLLDANARPPLQDQYVVSADISFGTGASNTVIKAASISKREVVLEFASPHIQPHEAARYAVALCRWLGGAFLIYEFNGPGQTFGAEVTRLGYRNCYMRQNLNSYGKKQKDEPGWVPTSGNKKMALADFKNALSAGLFIERSYETYEECKQYIYTAEDTVEHSGQKHNIDPSGAKGNHGDRVIASTLLWHALQRFKPAEKQAELVPFGTFRARQLAAQMNMRPVYNW